MLLREANIARLSDVRELRLEPDDALTVERTEETRPATTAELDAVRHTTPEATEWRSAAWGIVYFAGIDAGAGRRLLAGSVV